MAYMSAAEKALTLNTEEDTATAHQCPHRGGQGRDMLGPSRESGSSNELRGAPEACGQGLSNRATRVRRITGGTQSKRTFYNVGQRNREAMLEIVGIDLFNLIFQQMYHRLQERSADDPPLFLKKATCQG